MATHDEIVNVIETLARNTNGADRYAEEDFARMHRAWTAVDLAVLTRAADRHINKSSFFPSLADMNKLIEEESLSSRAHLWPLMTERDFQRELKEYERIQKEMEDQKDWAICEPCAGAGFVVRMPGGELVTLTYWRSLTGGTVPCGEPTDDCPWMKCTDCQGSGHARPSEAETLDAAFAKARAVEFDESLTA